MTYSNHYEQQTVEYLKFDAGQPPSTSESVSGDNLQNKRRNESKYCDYNTTFSTYDQSRQPNGLSELLEIFSQTNVPLQEQVILEGGFGTGAYITQIKNHVKTAYGVDGSEEGYQQALRKLEGVTNVHLQVGNILQLPFPDGYFHAYMINQVAHHLDTEPTFPNLDIFLEKARNVLVHGGVLTINTSAQEQLDPYSGSFWNYKYIPNTTYALQARYIPIEELVSRLAAFGFGDIEQTIPSGKMFQDRYYEDPTMALEPTFPQGDSNYSLLPQAELEEVNANIRASIEDGSIYDEMKQAAQRSAKIGEAVIVSARKLDS